MIININAAGLMSTRKSLVIMIIGIDTAVDDIVENVGYWLPMVNDNRC